MFMPVPTELFVVRILNPCLVLVQPRKTRPDITEKLLMGRKESIQTNKQTTKSEPVCFVILRSRGCRFEPHQHHCVVSLSKTH